MSNETRTSAYPLPLITVAMPVYNAGKYLRLAVLSIICQTYSNWELLIIDDGSTDDALQDIAEIHDARIRIFQDGENKGLAKRLNECIDMAQGQYFARMDQDDISYPERFEYQIKELMGNSRIDMVATRAMGIDADNNPISLFPYLENHEVICSRPWVGFYLPHPTWMGKISWFRQHRYKLPGSFYSEDMDLLLRSYMSSRFSMLPEVLFAYRVRRNIVWKKQVQARKAVLTVQLRAFRERHQWGYVCLAILVLVLRLASDSVRMVKQFMRISENRVCTVPDSIRNDWEKIFVAIGSSANRLVR